MTPLVARKRAFGFGRLAAGQFCRMSDLRRQPQPATLVDFRGSSLSDAGSIPAISTSAPLSGRAFHFGQGPHKGIGFDSRHLSPVQSVDK